MYMTTESKTLVLASGGIDSAVLLASAPEGAATALFVWYGAKHNQREYEYLQQFCKEREIPLRESHVSLGAIFEEPLDLTNDPVVGFRNGVFLSIAVATAIRCSYDHVTCAITRSDGPTFPDCRWPFLDSFSALARQGTDGEVAFSAPFVGLTKSVVIGLGKHLDMDFSKTWSCYEGAERPCMMCHACTTRAMAFMEAGIQDTLLTKEEWDFIVGRVKNEADKSTAG